MFCILIDLISGPLLCPPLDAPPDQLNGQCEQRCRAQHLKSCCGFKGPAPFLRSEHGQADAGYQQGQGISQKQGFQAASVVCPFHQRNHADDRQEIRQCSARFPMSPKSQIRIGNAIGQKRNGGNPTAFSSCNTSRFPPNKENAPKPYGSGALKTRYHPVSAGFPALGAADNDASRSALLLFRQKTPGPVLPGSPTGLQQTPAL